MATPLIYTAGKTWHATKFQVLRDVIGINVGARWIDLEQDSDLVVNNKDLLWQQCFEDVRDCDFVLVYCEDESEEQRGVLVEAGMAYAFDKPVYCINRCKTLAPNGISDVAFTHFSNWHWLESTDLLNGVIEAEALFLAKGSVEALKVAA